jgi:multidrug transporter EmrE-like cation transporter
MSNIISLPLIFIILAGVSFAFLGLSYKMASVRQCRPMAFSGIFLLIASVVSGICAVFEPVSWGDSRLWVLGISMGIILYITLALVVKVNLLGPASVTWVMMNLSIIIPIFLAPLLLQESLLAVDGILLVLFIFMLIALRRGIMDGADNIKGSSLQFWLLLSAMFILNGAFQFCSKLKNSLFQDSNNAGLAFIFYSGGMLMAIATHLIQTRGLRFTRHEIGIGSFAGISSGVANLLVLSGMSLPAIVVFPVTQGIALVGGVLLTVLIYKEKFNSFKMTGFLLSIIVLMLAIFREQIMQLISRF